MRALLSLSKHSRTKLTLRLSAVACLLLLALVAAACDAGGSEEPGDTGGLSFVPADAVTLVQVSLRTQDIDRSLDTLERLPIWSLAQAQLPASDGRGLRKAAGDSLLDSEESTRDMTFDEDIEPWLGDTAGFALLDRAADEPSSFEGDDPPVVGWVESTDDDRARQFVEKAASGDKLNKSEHEDVTIYTKPGEEGAVFVHEGALVLTGSQKTAEQLIDAQGSDDDTFVEQDYVEEMLDAGDRNEQFVAVASADRLLDLAQNAAREATDPEVRKLEQVLQDEDVRDLAPEVVSFSGGIDEVGLWYDTSWAPAAKQGISDARDLAEQMPADATAISAQSAQWSGADKLPQAWEAIRAAYGVELDQLTRKCSPAERDTCQLAVRFAKALLEGDLLNRISDAAGEHGAIVMAQWLRANMAQEFATISRVEDPAAIVGMSRAAIGELQPVLRKENVQVRFVEQGKDARVSVSVRGRKPPRPTPGVPQSPLIRDLYSPAGLQLLMRTVDDTTLAAALPARVLEPALAAWNGTAARIGESDTYNRDPDIAKTPNETSYYGWTDLAGVIKSAVAGSGGNPGQAEMINNNLRKVGGLVTWSTRSGDDGKVGTVRFVLPIHE